MMTEANPRIVVIGAGIVGASIAYHLAGRGVQVTIIDKGAPAAGATAKSFAWINVSSALDVPYARLRNQALGEWRRLEAEIGPALALEWCGTLFASAEASRTEQRVDTHAAWGFDIRKLERREIEALEPGLVTPPSVGAIAAGEGAVEPVAATAALVDGAQRAGVQLITNNEVRRINAPGTRVGAVELADRQVPADIVVVAAGTEAPALCAPFNVDVPIHPSPGLILRFETSGRLLNHVVVTSDMELRQVSDNQLLVGADYPDEAAGETVDGVAQRVTGQIGTRLRGGETATLTGVEVGVRPMPSDGFPIVGFSAKVDGLYLAAMHSGVTLAPAIGRFAAMEIVDRTAVAALDDYRPTRF
ncbi:MAG: FAD-dependent oxidoreductase [Pseudomonadota bacterium]